jgi:hypothetical protein
MVREFTGIPGAYRALPGGPETESKWDYLDLALLPATVALTALAPATGGTSLAAAGGVRMGLRSGLRYAAPRIAKGVASAFDPGVEAAVAGARYGGSVARGRRSTLARAAVVGGIKGGLGMMPSAERLVYSGTPIDVPGAVSGAKSSIAKENERLLKEQQEILRAEFETALESGDTAAAENIAVTLEELRGPTTRTRPAQKPLSSRISDAIKTYEASPGVSTSLLLTENEVRIMALRNPEALKAAKSSKGRDGLIRVYVEPREKAPLRKQLAGQKGRTEYKLLKQQLIEDGIMSADEVKALEKSQLEQYSVAYKDIFGLDVEDKATNYYFYTHRMEKQKDGSMKRVKVPLDEEPDHLNAQANLATFGSMMLQRLDDPEKIKALFAFINDPTNFAGLHKPTNMGMGAKSAEQYTEEGRDVYKLLAEGTHYSNRLKASNEKLREILGPALYKEYLDFNHQIYKKNLVNYLNPGMAVE